MGKLKPLFSISLHNGPVKLQHSPRVTNLCLNRRQLPASDVSQT